jgi:hypothetical protein
MAHDVPEEPTSGTIISISLLINSAENLLYSTGYEASSTWLRNFLHLTHDENKKESP